MSISPRIRDVVRQEWAKRQPRRPKPKKPGKSRTLRLVGIRSGGLCERCGGPGHSTHHLVNEGQGGPWSPENCVRLCGSGSTLCHGWVTTHPVEAGLEGFHLQPWEIPGTRPIKSKLHGLVLLRSDGSVEPIEGGAA